MTGPGQFIDTVSFRRSVMTASSPGAASASLLLQEMAGPITNCATQAPISQKPALIDVLMNCLPGHPLHNEDLGSVYCPEQDRMVTIVDHIKARHVDFEAAEQFLTLIVSPITSSFHAIKTWCSEHFRSMSMISPSGQHAPAFSTAQNSALQVEVLRLKTTSEQRSQRAGRALCPFPKSPTKTLGRNQC